MHSTLAAETGGYVVTRADQVQYHPDGSGVLQRENDRNGNSLTFSYTGADLTTITDTVGRAITLGYTSGLLTSLTGPWHAGLMRTVSYGYDTNGRLNTVTDVRGDVTYTSSGNA